MTLGHGCWRSRPSRTETRWHTRICVDNMGPRPHSDAFCWSMDSSRARGHGLLIINHGCEARFSSGSRIELLASQSNQHMVWLHRLDLTLEKVSNKPLAESDFSSAISKGGRVLDGSGCRQPVRLAARLRQGKTETNLVDGVPVEV